MNINQMNSEQKIDYYRQEIIIAMTNHGYDGFDAEYASVKRHVDNEWPQDVIELHNKLSLAFDEFEAEKEASEKEAAEKMKQEVEGAKERIKNGTHTNADLYLMVEAGLARNIYGQHDSNAPTSIEWLDPGPGNPYADNYEEAFVTRG